MSPYLDTIFDEQMSEIGLPTSCEAYSLNPYIDTTAWHMNADCNNTAGYSIKLTKLVC